MFLFKINYSCATHNENICEVFVRETSIVYMLTDPLKVHKNENFFSSDFEFCTFSMLVMVKYFLLGH